MQHTFGEGLKGLSTFFKQAATLFPEESPAEPTQQAEPSLSRSGQVGSGAGSNPRPYAPGQSNRTQSGTQDAEVSIAYQDKEYLGHTLSGTKKVTS